ncbi:MAG: hypothetical protein M3126_02880 [Candidatus Eremiobacteraeota bacterium]|nr:hypothetical protein [Candidatus Eremiobacteraeota bacterium]
MTWLKVNPPLDAAKPVPRAAAGLAVFLVATAFVLDFALAVDFFAGDFFALLFFSAISIFL